MNKQPPPHLRSGYLLASAVVALSFLWARGAASYAVARPWPMGYEMALLSLMLVILEIGRRLLLPAALQMASVTTTRSSRRNAKAPHRLGARDKLGELAAAFDRLAETLCENETRPDDKSRLQDSAAWLAALARFTRALRLCTDFSAIERALAEVVESTLPGFAVALQVSGNSGFAGSHFGGDRAEAESLKRQAWRCYARIPLLVSGEVLGALCIYGRERPKLSALETDFLNLVGDRTALAVEELQRSEMRTEPRRAGPGAFAEPRAAHTDFISIVSHEFRTPLSLIMGYTEMVHEELMGKITSEQRKCLERVMKASDELLALVNNVLQAGRLESGCVEISKREVRLSDLLGELRAELPKPQAKELEFVWDIPEDLPCVNTDADHLKGILQQLIGNALKFTEQGHVTVSSRSLLEAGKVEISVRDSGIGIAEHVLPALFEKYRQLDSSATRTYDGIGLGLYVARKLTDLLGGELKVTSRPAMGSTFTVVLPIET